MSNPLWKLGATETAELIAKKSERKLLSKLI